jgi:LmbE family N-acetylglucosaminyl deacetylase
MHGAIITRPNLIDPNKIRGKRIVAFGAHSDDVEFLAAGTMMQLSVNNEIEIVIATDGQMGTHSAKQNGEDLTKVRIREAQEGAKFMGVQKVMFWSYPDLNLQIWRKQLLKRVVKYLVTNKPDLVLSFDPWGRYEAYVHPDHRTLAWAVTEGVMLATLPKWIKKNKIGNGYLSPKPQHWLWAPAEANVAVEVTGVWQRRMELLKVFNSQFDNDFEWERISKMIAKMYADIGRVAGVEYAEGFRILEYTGEWDKNS